MRLWMKRLHKVRDRVKVRHRDKDKVRDRVKVRDRDKVRALLVKISSLSM